MKNKIVTIILGVCLVVSLAGNVYFFNNVTKNKDAVDAYSNQLVTAEGQINGLQEEVSNLQQQLAESEDIIASLEEEKENSNIIVGSNVTSSDSVIETDDDRALQEQIERENNGEVYVPTPEEAAGTGSQLPQLDPNADKYEDFGEPIYLEEGALGETVPGHEGWWSGLIGH